VDGVKSVFTFCVRTNQNWVYYLDHDGHLSDVSIEWHLSDSIDFPSTANHDTTIVRHSTLATLLTHRLDYCNSVTTMCKVHYARKILLAKY